MKSRHLTDPFNPARHSLQGWMMLLWGCGAFYGFSLGIWRSPLQGIYTGIKFPLLLSLVILGNALLNTVTAAILGIPMRFRLTLHVLTTCYGVFALVLASCVPVFLFFTFSLPSLESADAQQVYRGIVLMHVLLISLAGCGSHIHLFESVVRLCGEKAKARRLMFCWLTANLLLGAQLSWNLRPFFGTPDAPVEFVRENPFDRNFFEAVYSISRSTLETLQKE